LQASKDVCTFAAPFIRLCKLQTLINMETETQQATGEALRAGAAFVVYVRTLQFFTLRLRGENEQRKPVHIPQKEIETTFFKWPDYDRKTEIAKLIEAGEIAIHSEMTSTGKTLFKYAALKRGPISFEHIKPKGLEPDEITGPMLENLKWVSLPKGAPSTLYFDLFLQAKEKFCRLFFTIDKFAGRVHTPVTNFHRTHRPNLLLYGEKTVSLDVTTMQPLLLGKILLSEIGANDFSTWLNEGWDIYKFLQQLAGLSNRDEGKKRFFEILFSKPNDSLSKLFGASNWIDWVNAYKRQKITLNPTTEEKRHNNVAWLLQSTEVAVMRQVWDKLNRAKIPFLSVHDEIIVMERNAAEAEGIFSDVLKQEFVYFKLNSKGGQQFEPSPTPEPQIDWSKWAESFEAYFKTVTVPPGPLKINACTTVSHPKASIIKHIETLKSNGPPRLMQPYFQRLQEFKKAIQ
jgi:hypothetical protein